MKRESVHLASSQNGKVKIYIDSENMPEIIAYSKRSNRHIKRWQYIIGVILDNKSTQEHYRLVRINDDTKDVREMRFFVGQENDRIYCKHIETEEGIKIIVASVLHEKKKNTKLKHAEKVLVNAVGTYIYEI